MAESALTDPQLDVLHLFFDLPESAGFVLAGGACAAFRVVAADRAAAWLGAASTSTIRRSSSTATASVSAWSSETA